MTVAISPFARLDRRTAAEAEERLLSVIDVGSGCPLRNEDVGAVWDVEIARRDTGNGCVEFGYRSEFGLPTTQPGRCYRAASSAGSRSPLRALVRAEVARWALAVGAA